MSLPRRCLPCREIRWVLVRTQESLIADTIRHNLNTRQVELPSKGPRDSPFHTVHPERKGRCCGTRSRRGAGSSPSRSTTRPLRGEYLYMFLSLHLPRPAKYSVNPVFTDPQAGHE